MKRVLSLTISLLLIASIFSCAKKQTTIGNKTFDTSKNYNICIASSVDSEDFDAMRKGFVVGLKDLGLVEDINVTYHYENAKSNENYAKQIAEAFKDKNPDLIVSMGSTVTEAIKEKFDKTPIVFLAVSNAERLGYCDAQGNPKANLTGVIDSQLYEEQLDFVKKYYTEVEKTGIIYTSGDKLSEFFVDYFKFYATSYGIDIYTVAIKKADDVSVAIGNILPKVDAMTLIPDNIVDMRAKEIVEAAKSVNKVTFGSTAAHKQAGAEVSVERDFTLVGEKAAELAKSILVDKKKVSDVKVVNVDFKTNHF